MPEQPRYDVVAQFNNTFDYGRDKRALQDESEQELEGIRALTFETNHNYLRDLQTQQKRKYFPTMAEDSQDFSQLLFPASKFMLGEIGNVPKDQQSNTPLTGNWSNGERAEVSMLSPAGQRIPKHFKIG